LARYGFLLCKNCSQQIDFKGQKMDVKLGLGHAAVLVFDESAFAKKGDQSACVARPWEGRLGKKENIQVGAFVAWMRDRACALVDGDLFVPEHGFDDPQRCREVGMPERLEFRTQGEIALAREGPSDRPATDVFPESEIEVLAHLQPALEGKTEPD
jgi:hypothetical protein